MLKREVLGLPVELDDAFEKDIPLSAASVVKYLDGETGDVFYVLILTDGTTRVEAMGMAEFAKERLKRGLFSDND